MAALQHGRNGAELGQVTAGGSVSAGAVAGSPSSTSISGKFHERPGGGEISQVTNKGDGLSK
jgi:hypothetical protein